MPTSEIRYFVDCPTCGPATLGENWGQVIRCGTCHAPIWGVEYRDTYGARTVLSPYGKLIERKAVIHNIARPRRIDVKLSGGSSGRKCGAQCVNGKRTCDCRCLGRCHGMSRCLGGHE